jgi:hypothetical protein
MIFEALLRKYWYRKSVELGTPTWDQPTLQMRIPILDERSNTELTELSRSLRWNGHLPPKGYHE